MHSQRLDRGATNHYVMYIKKIHHQRPVSLYKVAIRDVDVHALLNTVSNLLFVHLTLPSLVLRPFEISRGNKVMYVTTYLSLPTSTSQ